MTTESLIAILEPLIDEQGLDHVLEAIQEICYLKEEHVRSNWQDHDLAEYWAKVGRALSKVSMII